VQKLQGVSLLAKALNNGRNSIEEELIDNKNALTSRRYSPRVNNLAVKRLVKILTLH
jgi:5-methyltetrahydropteroyltriglutamate--homocysteine methyltransferase